MFSTIASKLKEKGCVKTWVQCRNKIKNLKKKYREVKDHNSLTGRGRTTCKFYDILDGILGHRPASAPVDILDSGIDANGMLCTLFYKNFYNNNADGVDVVAVPPREEATGLVQEAAQQPSQPAVADGDSQSEVTPVAVDENIEANITTIESTEPANGMKF